MFYDAFLSITRIKPTKYSKCIGSDVTCDITMPRTLRMVCLWLNANSPWSALYSTHQNHIDREGLRLNFEKLKSRNRRFSEIVRMIFTNNRTSKSHHSRETNRKNMAGILSCELVFDRKIAENFGYVSSVEAAYKLIAEFETRSTTKFSCFKVDKDFGNICVYLRFI